MLLSYTYVDGFTVNTTARFYGTLNTYPHTTKYLHSYRFYKCNTYEFIKHNLISKSGISFWHKIEKEVLGRICSLHGLLQKL